jgi:hypothetical protein
VGEGFWLESRLVAGDSAIAWRWSRSGVWPQFAVFSGGFWQGCLLRDAVARHHSSAVGASASEDESGSDSTAASTPIIWAAHSRTAATVSSALFRSSGGASKGSVAELDSPRRQRHRRAQLGRQVEPGVLD